VIVAISVALKQGVVLQLRHYEGAAAVIQQLEQRAVSGVTRGHQHITAALTHRRLGQRRAARVSCTLDTKLATEQNIRRNGDAQREIPQLFPRPGPTR
jgi:hypothetical protein